MLFGNVLYFMRGGLKQLCLDLNRRVAQQTQYLRLRLDLCRHKIENKYFQRAYILRYCPFLGHNENIFILQQLMRRQIAVYFYRHDFLPFTLHMCNKTLVLYNTPFEKENQSIGHKKRICGGGLFCLAIHPVLIYNTLWFLNKNFRL